jgi:hypothetical protein
MRRRASGFLLGVALLAAAVLPAAAAPKPYDQMAPENTTLFVNVRNVSDYLKRLEASPLGEAWNSEDMKPFVGKLGDAFDLLFKEAGKTLGYSLKDYKDLLQGEAAFILGDPSSIEFKAERPELPIALLIDVGSRKEKALEFLRKNLELIEKDGKVKKREEEFRGAKLVCLEGKEPKPGDLKAVVLTVADDLFAISFSQSFLQDVLANRGDASMKSLSEHPDYRALRGRFGSESDFFAYAHVGRWLDSLPKIVKATGGADAESNLGTVIQVLDTLGIAGLRSVVISGSITPEGITQTIFVQTAGAPKGLLKVVASQPQALRFPVAVPEDVSQASIVLVDFEALWSVVESAVKMVQATMGGGAAPGIDPLQAFEEQLGISVKRDLFGAFGKQVVIYERLKKPYTVQSQSMAILIELRDKAKFQAALEKLIALVPFLQKKEYLGRPLYTVAMPGMDDAGDPNTPAPPMPAICLTDTHFVFANQKEMAEEAIRRVGKEVRSVNDSPAFKGLEGRYPASSTAISYATAEGFDYLFFMAKQLAKGELPGLPPGLLNLDDADPNDTGVKFFKAIQDAFGRLPNASVFTSRIAGGVGWGFVDEKGIGITSKFLFKTATK